MRLRSSGRRFIALSMRFQRAPRVSPQALAALDPADAKVLAKVYGTSDIEALVRTAGVSHAVAASTVGRLFHAGALVLVDHVPRRSLPAPDAAADDAAATCDAALAAGAGAELAGADNSATGVAHKVAEGDSTQPPAATDAVAFADDAQEPEEGLQRESVYRARYAQKFAGLPLDERTKLARYAQNPDLIALAYDPSPSVIAAIFENTHLTLESMRIVAQHHLSAQGLDALSRARGALTDPLIRRRLLRNNHCSEALLRKLVALYRLLKLYQLLSDRDAPELVRTRTRGIFRARWSQTTAEERAELLISTEGRCLSVMAGLTFDAKLTALLCARPVVSTVFIQSVARFSASPPGLLAHLIKQPLVRRQSHLRALLAQHPNLPADAKRSL
jgi:hypothetical protein